METLGQALFTFTILCGVVHLVTLDTEYLNETEYTIHVVSGYITVGMAIFFILSDVVLG